jgi:hypothetical protein
MGTRASGTDHHHVLPLTRDEVRQPAALTPRPAGRSVTSGPARSDGSALRLPRAPADAVPAPGVQRYVPPEPGHVAVDRRQHAPASCRAVTDTARGRGEALDALRGSGSPA